jgi:hypothetical protein
LVNTSTVYPGRKNFQGLYSGTQDEKKIKQKKINLVTLVIISFLLSNFTELSFVIKGK